MAIDASDLPMEGQNLNSDRLLPDVTSIMMDLPKIAKQIGARQPIPLGGGRQLHTPNQPFKSPPSSDIVPDVPRSLKLPQPKMMPGSDTPPGQLVSKDVIDEFNRRISETNTLQAPQFNPVIRNAVQEKSIEPKYFEDCAGNKFKTVGDDLYIMGWQDANVKVRMVNEKTGKVIPSDGRKFQIYGWHLVNKINKESDESKVKNLRDVDDINKFEKSVNIQNETSNENIDTNPTQSTVLMAVETTVKDEQTISNKTTDIPETKIVKNTELKDTAADTDNVVKIKKVKSSSKRKLI